MSANNLHQQITNLLETIAEQHKHIASRTGRIPQIELDLVLSNIRKLYEHLTVLNEANRGQQHMAAPAPQPAATVAPAPFEEEAPAKPAAVAPPVVEEKEIPSQPATIEASAPKFTPVAAEAPAVQPPTPQPVAPQPAPTQPAPARQAPVTLFDDSPIVAQSFKDKPSFQQQMAGNNISDSAVVDKLKKQKVADLKSVIGINEKFQFINELFDGNLQEYNEKISTINEMSSREEAMSFIQSNLHGKYKWEKAPQTVDVFNELLSRRFGD